MSKEKLQKSVHVTKKDWKGRLVYPSKQGKGQERQIHLLNKSFLRILSWSTIQQSRSQDFHPDMDLL